MLDSHTLKNETTNPYYHIEMLKTFHPKSPTFSLSDFFFN